MIEHGSISPPHPLRVAVDARVAPGAWGGVQQVVEGLATGLSGLGGPEEYLFLAGPDTAAWLRPRLAGPCRLVVVEAAYGRTRWRRAYDRLSTATPPLARAMERGTGRLGRAAVSIPSSDGSLESLGADLVHFVLPQAVLTPLPSIYQPHDLLHYHQPGTMTPLRAAYRDRAYRAFSAQAAAVAVMTEWGRDDIVRAFGLAPGKVVVVPWPPAVGVASRARGESLPAGLPDRFLLYPAQTWPHKNHLGLLDALAVLRDRDVLVPLVCTGVQNEHFGAVRRRTAELGLGDRVHYLGYVSDARLTALYQAATALVFPSRFEGWGLPVVEAFAHGLPVACSNATVLPEVAGGAAELFDPDDATDMANAIERVWANELLRADLVARGRARVATLTWGRTARTFRALYRRVAGRALTNEDHQLLAPPVLVP